MDKILTLRLRVTSTGDAIEAESFDADATGEWIARRTGFAYLGGHATPTPETPKVSIRPAKSRNPFGGGFSPADYPVTTGFGVTDGRSRIFTTTKTSAEKIATRLRNFEEVRLSDFQP